MKKILGLFFGLLCIPLAALAGPTIRQKAQGFTGVTTTITVAYGSNNLAHNLLVLWAFENISPQQDHNNVSDTAGNSWVMAKCGIGTQSSTCIWYVCDSKAGANSVTVSNSQTNLLHLHILEVTGIKTSSCLNATGQASATSSAPSVTTSTSAASGDFVLAGFENDSARTYTADLTLVQAEAGSFSFNSMTESTVTVSAGTVTAAPTQSGSAGWFTTIATFTPLSTAVIKHKPTVIRYRRRKVHPAAQAGRWCASVKREDGALQ